MSFGGTGPQRRREREENAVCQFLKDIEDEFKYAKFFHSQQKIIMEEQYIPIRVIPQRRHRRKVESEEEVKSAHGIKSVHVEPQKSQIPWKEAKEQHTRIMVLADPGMGKSTLLKVEAGATAREERQKLSKNEKNVDDLIFPIFLKLSDLDTEEEISQAISTLIIRHYPRTSEGTIHLLAEKLNEGKCLLLLDALDEVGKEHQNSLSEKLNRFAYDYPCPIICTSRTVGYAGAFLDGAEEIEIVPFSQEQIDQYVRTWFINAAGSVNDDSVSADDLLRELKDEPLLQGSARIPLLLSLLCSLYQEGGHTLPAQRCQIYGEAVEYMLSRWSQNTGTQSEGRIRAKFRLLEELAYHFTCEGKQVFSSEELHGRVEEYLQREEVSTDLRDTTTADELITELCEKDGIIQLEKNGESYTFLHWDFQEYLTASYLSRSRDGIELAREHFWEYDWHEALSLLAGLMADPVPLLRAITDEKDDIFSSLLLLAGRCIAECEEHPNPLITEIVDRIYELWRNYPFVDFVDSVVWALGQANSQMSEKLRRSLNDEYAQVREAAVKALAEVGSQQAVDALVQTVKHADSDARWKAAEALAEIGSQQVVETLVRTLRAEESAVRRYAAWTLGRIGSEQLVEPLTRALNDEDSSVRYYAAWGLGEIGSEQAIKPLIQTLKGEDEDVRGAAARALSKIGSEQAAAPLILALNDKDSDVRWSAAEVLGGIGGEQAVEPLIRALDDEDSGVREAAMEALGRIGSEQAIEPLIQALNSEDSSIRGTAARALGKIGSQRPIEPLIQVLNDEDSDVREAAAGALSEIGGEQAIEPLIRTLSDEDSNVRGMAAEALGEVGKEQATEPLIRALDDEDCDVRWAAATALGQIGSQQAVEPLIKAFDDENSDVREAAAAALGKIIGQQAAKPLTYPFNRKNRYVREAAAIALSESDSQQVVGPLTYALKHRVSYVREAAAKALGEISSRQAVDALMQALSDEDSDVRHHAVRALGRIDNQQVVESLIQMLEDDNIHLRRDAAEFLRRTGTSDTLGKILRSPTIDVYDPDIFPLARMLAVRFSREETSFIPVYPELLT